MPTSSNGIYQCKEEPGGTNGYQVKHKAPDGEKKERSHSDATWWLLLTLVTNVSLITRLHKLSEPKHVCWDETHFGKMGSFYINGFFFFDVHPPLGKMLIGLAGHLTGYDGGFAFDKPGDLYGETNYLGMRVFCAVMGAFLVPLAYCITWELSASLSAALLAAALVAFDTGVLTLSQYILLDPLLLVFIMAATFCSLKVQSARHKAFSLVWWLWLSLTGVFLSAAIGVKFVGLFVILLVGLSTARDLWDLLGDLSVPLGAVVKHVLARSLCLIALPIALYLVSFGVHFTVLRKSGSGDGFYSSAFQSQLRGNPLYNASMPSNVAYGSVITLKSHRTGGAYLHSHWHLYPEGVGARQQQVTTYSHKDENNKWRVLHHDRMPEEGSTAQLINNGDLIRLSHVATQRNLHSHREMAPLTKRHLQVTCYGMNGSGDANDIWRVVVPGAPQGAALNTVKTTFRLVHYNAECALHSHNKQLPKWGWEQMEVTCHPRPLAANTLWNVEEVSDPRLPSTSFQVFAPSLWHKIVETHAVMTQGNRGLKPKEGEVTSRPWQWPINYRGQPFSGGDLRVYLLGNPAIWWLCGGVLAIFPLLALCEAARDRRWPPTGQGQQARVATRRTLSGCWWLLVGWALHYLPFWTMTRVLYFHHYFPAFLYSAMLTAILVDHYMERVVGLVTSHWASLHAPLHATLLATHGAVLAALAYSFYVFSPLSYGAQGPLSSQEGAVMAGLRWLPTWDF